MDENFIVDFGEVTRVTTEDFNKLNNRPSYAGELMTGDTDIPQVPSSVSELNNDSNYQTGAQVSEAIETETGAREAADTALDGRLTTVEGIAATALQPSSIDKVVMTDINVGANTSTTTFNLDASKQNLLTGATSSKQVSMPVASSTEAGIMNSATFDAVANNTANINALANGAVAITGLPSSPTQAQLTTAWENATGETSLMNRAGIYDVTNGKVWTYYTNDTTWHSTTNTTQVTINTFTNSSEGTIKGSTNVGQVFAEADGTGSVNGWDALNDAVENNSSNISDLQTAVDGKQDKLIAGANINIAADGKTISATDTTYTAGNAIDITNGEISADIHPADFFTASDSTSECGSNLSLDNTIATKLKSVEVKGDTYQQTYSGKNLIDSTSTTYVYSNSPSQVTLTAIEGGIRIMNSGGESQGRFVVFKSIDLTSYTGKVVRMKATFGTSGGIRLYRIASDGSNRTQAASTTVSGNEISFTVPEDLGNSPYLGYVLEVTVGNNTTVDFTDMIMTVDAELEPFEPYVGGIPAPNPDYPQDIQVVTGEQTINVRGENMFNVNKPLENKYLDNSGGWTTATYSYVNQEYIVTGSRELSFSFAKRNGSSIIRVGEFKTDGTFIKRTLVSTASTLTLDALTNKIILSVDNLSPNYFDELQIELGPSPTSYQPYASQSYTVDLGSIELCKIGGYQDYIYKSGDDWYVHKTCGKTLITGGATEDWSYSSGSSGQFRLPLTGGYYSSNSEAILAYCDYYLSVAWDSVSLYDYAMTSFQANRLIFRNTAITSLDAWKTWLSSHNMTVYYALATPTDTQITDATLVGQLDALAEAKSYNNQTNVVVTAAGENLPATLCVEAYRKSLSGLLGAIERLGE